MTKGIIYLDKGSLDLYAEKMTVIPRLTFPAGLVADLEILDVTKLDQAVKAFIDANKLLPASLSIVISPNLTFTKDILDPKAPKVADPKKPVATPVSDKTEEQDVPTLDELKQAYLETVPFDEVGSITLPIQNGIKVIAANKTMFSLIKRSFEKYGFTIEGVTSLLVFGNTVLPVDQTISRKLLTKVDMVKQHNMLTVAPPPQTKKEGFVITKPSETKDGNKRAFMLLGVLGLLFLVMGYLLYQMLNDPTTKKKPKKAKTTVTAVVTTSPTPSITDVASESAAISFSDMTFQIITPSKASSTAASLRNALEDAKAKDITLTTRATTASRMSAVYSPELTPEQVSALTAFLTKEATDAVIRKGEDQTIDVIITLPKE